MISHAPSPKRRTHPTLGRLPLQLLKALAYLLLAAGLVVPLLTFLHTSSFDVYQLLTSALAGLLAFTVVGGLVVTLEALGGLAQQIEERE